MKLIAQSTANECLIMINNDDIYGILTTIKSVASCKAEEENVTIKFTKYSDRNFDKFSHYVLNNIDIIKHQLDYMFSYLNGYFSNSDFFDKKIQFILKDIKDNKSFSESNNKLLMQLKKDLNKNDFDILESGYDGINSSELIKLVKLNSNSIVSATANAINLESKLHDIFNDLANEWKENYGIDWDDFYISSDDLFFEVVSNDDEDEDAYDDALLYTEDLQEYISNNAERAVCDYIEDVLNNYGINDYVDLNMIDSSGLSVYDDYGQIQIPILKLKGLSLNEQINLIEKFKEVYNKYGFNDKAFNNDDSKKYQLADKEKFYLAVKYE